MVEIPSLIIKDFKIDLSVRKKSVKKGNLILTPKRFHNLSFSQLAVTDLTL